MSEIIQYWPSYVEGFPLSIMLSSFKCDLHFTHKEPEVQNP